MPKTLGVPAGSNSSSPSRNHIFLVFIALLGAWLCFPALTSVHVEAFSANLQSIAILLHRHGGAGLKLADQQYPIVTEYLYMTRSGLVDALQFLMSITGSTSDRVFRCVILLSFVGYFLACRRIARTWSDEPNAFLILAFLLTPGMVEIAFYFADNLSSAMFAMVGLAFIRRSRPTPAWLWCAAGACLAIATLIRVDAVLTLPAFALGLLLFRNQVWHIVRSTLAFALGGFAVLLLAELITPFQLSDSLQISHLFQALHQGYESHTVPFRVAHAFFGPITCLLMLLGVIHNIRTRRWKWHIGFTLLPIAFYLYVLPHALEVRMFLLLGGPAVLIQAATGLGVLRAWWDTGIPSRRVLASAFCLLFAVVLFGPVIKITSNDGPRAVLGRFWSPLIWREWQQGIDDDMGHIDDVVKSVQPHETVLVVMGHYNADHYLQLRLLQAGFEVTPKSAEPDAECSAQLETFRNHERTVIFVRSEIPYSMTYGDNPAAYQQAFQVKSELGCAQHLEVTRGELLSWRKVPEFFVPILDGKPTKSPDWRVTLPIANWIPTRKHCVDGKIYVQALNGDQIKQLMVAAQTYVSTSESQLHTVPIEEYQQLRSMYRWHFGAFATK